MDPDIGWMNERYAIVERHLTGVLVLDPGFDGRRVKHLPELIRAECLHLLYRNKLVKVGKKDVRLSDYWLDHPDRKQIHDFGLYPPGRVPPRCLNLFEGFIVAPAQGAHPKIDYFLREIICNGDCDAYAYLYNFICWWLQHICEPVPVNLVLTGPQGIGKDTFVECLLAGLVGRQHLLTLDRPDALSSQFNGHWEGKLIMFFNEAIFGHDQKVSGRAKSLATSETIPIHPKFMTPYDAPNLSLKVYASNHPAALPIDYDDRRYLVLDVSAKHKEDTVYFQDFRRAMDGGERAAFLHDALTKDLTGFDPRKVHKTQAWAELADMTAQREDAYIVHLLEKGELPGEKLTRKPGGGWSIAQGDQWPNGDTAARTDEIYCDYRLFIEAWPGKRPRSKEEVGKRLRTLLTPRGVGGSPAVKRDQIRHPTNSATRDPYYVFRSLSDCRAAFDAYTGRARNWSPAPAAQPPVIPAQTGQVVPMQTTKQKLTALPSPQQITPPGGICDPFDI